MDMFHPHDLRRGRTGGQVTGEQSTFSSDNGTTATIGWNDSATSEEIKQLIDAMRSIGYAWVAQEYYEPESGFTFMELER